MTIILLMSYMNGGEKVVTGFSLKIRVSSDTSGDAIIINGTLILHHTYLTLNLADLGSH